MGICMNVLSNVYCLGCKTRHPEVKIDEVITMNVKGSIRYQGKGVCENGKTWCKILKPDEIPSEYLEKPPNEDMGDSLSVFEKGAEISKPEEPVIEEPVMEDPIIEEPVMEKPIIEKPIIEEPVIEEPVMEEPIIEEPVHVPQPLSPADIESFDIPIVPDTFEAPQTYYDGTNGLEEDEMEDEEETISTQPVRVRRTPTFVPQRQPYVETKLSEPEPRFKPEPQVVRKTNEQDEIEKAKKVGDFMGRSMFNSVGDEYPKYLQANWKRTKIPDEHFEYFEASYLAAGAVKSADVKAEESQMDAKTVAGIAGIGILAAWFASQLNNRDSP